VSFGTGGEPVRVSGRGVSWWQLRYAHLVAIRSWLLERGLAPASVNLHLVALRRVLKECWRLGHLSGEDYQRAAAVPGVAGSRLPAGRALADRELAALLQHAPPVRRLGLATSPCSPPSTRPGTPERGASRKLG